MRKIINITADLFEEDLYKKFTIKQYDDIELRVKILSRGVLYDTTGQSVRLYCKKSDGTILYQTEDIVNNNNEIIIKARNQATTCAGLVYAELELFDEHGKISTGTFTYSVSDKVGTVEDAIESIDEIYILEEIEQFIAQAKIDIAKYKEDALQLQEVILTASEKVDEFNQTINTTKEEAIQQINSNKNALIQEIITNKDNSLIEINSVKNGIIEDINAVSNTNLDAIKAIKTELEGLNGTAQIIKTELEAEKNNAISVKDELNTLKTSSSELLTNLTNKVNEANSSKIDIENVLQSMTTASNTANELIISLTAQNVEADANILELSPLNTEADANIEELKALITEAREIAIPALKAYIAEHKPAEDLTEVNRQLEELYNSITELNIRFADYYTKIDTDNLLNNKVDKIAGKDLSTNDFTNELKAKLEGLENADLTNYYNKLETDAKIDEKIGLIDFPETDLTNYYNKLETENKIDEKIALIPPTDLSNYYNKKEIDKKLEPKIGFIEDNAVNTIFDEYPISTVGEPPAPDFEPVNTYICGKLSSRWTFVCYFKKDISKSVTLNTSNNRHYITGITDSDVKIYCYDTSYTKWRTDLTLSDLTNDTYGVTAFYYHDFDIYDKTDTTKIVRRSSEHDSTNDTNDFNNAIVLNIYNVIQTNAILNSPFEGFYEGVLQVEKAGNVIKQRLNVSNNDVYERTCNNGAWSEWIKNGESGCYTKAETESIIFKLDNELENFDYGLLTRDEYKYQNPAWIEFPSTTFINVPANPDPEVYKWIMKCTHYNYHMIFYFPVDPTGKFGVFKDASGEHFKLLDSTFKCTTYKGYYKSQSTSTTSWTALSTDSHFTATTRLLNAMYEHNFDIVDANDPTKVYYKGKVEGIPDIKTNFNECITYKKYKVNQASSNVLLNSPTTKDFKGVLNVEKIDIYIQQKLETTDGEKYARLYDGKVWSSWSVIGGIETISPDQIKPDGSGVVTPSMFALLNGNLRVEYGEYIVDKAKNSPYVADSEREYTDIIYLKQGGFKKILGCVAFPNRVDFHYSMWININMLIVDETIFPDCLRIYMNYNPPTALWKGDPWNPETGLKKFKYCVIGY